MNGNYAGQKADVDELLADAKLPLLDPSSPVYALLARELIKAKQRVYEEEQRRWQGDYSHAPAAAVTQVGTAPVAPVVPTKPFSEVVTLYLKEHHTRQARTQGMIESAFKAFLDVIGGDKPVGDITELDCRAFKDSMVTAQRKAATVNKHLHSLDHLFRWAKGQGYVADGHVSPVTGLRIAKSIQKKEALKRIVFTAEELQRLVDHPAFKRERIANPERYWVVLLCMYAGLRREEAAQLLVSQVVQDAASGVWFFDITEDGDGQSLKNAASKRRVPLHASLIALGFLEYVAQVRDETKHSRLFFQCKASANGYGDALGKWAGRLLHHTLKFPLTLVVHSLRHGFITGLHAASVPDQLVFALCGHRGSGGEVHLGYTHRESFPLKTLSEAVSKLDFGLV